MRPILACAVLASCIISTAQGEEARDRQQIAQTPQGKPLAGKDLAATLSGKKLWSRRQEGVSGADPTKVVRPRNPFTVTFFFRPDGSYLRECVSHDPMGDRDCGPSDGRTNVGVWYIENDRVCLRGARHEGRAFMCGSAIRMSPTILYMQWQPVPPAFDGPWNLRNP